MRMFPIMTDGIDIAEVRKSFGCAVVVALPWPMMEAHAPQALENHDQSIAVLASRCGLSACEALAVLEDRPWRAMSRADAHSRLKDLFNVWVAENIKLGT
jgi:hypothetical protein